MENSNVIIRPFQESYKAQVQKICLSTGLQGIWKMKKMQQMLLRAFCDYYIECEPQNCFIAVDGEKAIGYILCAENCDAWVATFEEKYLSPLGKSPMLGFYRSTMNAAMKYGKEYPAHLHIDILPEYQRMGIGFKLMDTLTTHLKSKGVPGLMLSVAADNEKGKRFYEKYGFAVLETTPQEIVMTINL